MIIESVSPRRSARKMRSTRFLHERTRIRRGRVALGKMFCDLRRVRRCRLTTLCSSTWRGVQPVIRSSDSFNSAVRVPSRVRPALAAAAVVLMTVAGVTYFGRNRVTGLPSDTQSNATTQPLLIDYRGEGTTRSEAGDPARKSVTVPRANLEATIMLPVGSEPGQYELRLLDGAKRSRLAKEATATLKEFAVRMAVNLDLRSLPSGAYTLEIRRRGEDWDPHPLVIR